MTRLASVPFGKVRKDQHRMRCAIGEWHETAASQHMAVGNPAARRKNFSVLLTFYCPDVENCSILLIDLFSCRERERGEAGV